MVFGISMQIRDVELAIRNTIDRLWNRHIKITKKGSSRREYVTTIRVGRKFQYKVLRFIVKQVQK